MTGPFSRFRHDQRGFTGAEKALLITCALALLLAVGTLLRSGSTKAGQDAERTLIAGLGSSVSALGQALRPIPATDGIAKPGEIGNTAEGGKAEKSEAPSVSLKIADVKSKPDPKKSVEVKRAYGGAKDAAAKEEADPKDKKDKKDWKSAVELEVKKDLVKKEGALAEKQFGDDKTGLKLQAGAAGVGADVSGKASLKEGLEGGLAADARVSAFRATGQAALPLGLGVSGEGNVLSANANIDTKAGISRDVVGAKLSAGASANLAEGKVSGSETLHIPFTHFGIQLSGGASGAIGANAAVDGQAGYFHGENGQPSRFGFNFGAKAAIGLGGGLNLGLNLVWD